MHFHYVILDTSDGEQRKASAEHRKRSILSICVDPEKITSSEEEDDSHTNKAFEADDLATEQGDRRIIMDTVHQYTTLCHVYIILSA